MPPHIIETLPIPLELENPWTVMASIVAQQELAPPLRQSPWSSAVSALLKAIKPESNPFWILFGFDQTHMNWRSSNYDFMGAPSLAELQKKAGELLNIMTPVDFSSWPGPIARKWACLLQGVHALVSGGFPCFPMIAWGGG